MGVRWRYLDKRDGAENALKDYKDQEYSLKAFDKTIKSLEADKENLRMLTYDDPTGLHSTQKSESQVIQCMEEMDAVRQQKKAAEEYMEWFLPAWEQLSEDDRFVLQAFYMDSSNYGSSAAQHVMEHFHIEQSSAYNKKNRALTRLTKLLYGKL